MIYYQTANINGTLKCIVRFLLLRMHELTIDNIRVLKFINLF